tara:strand:+ start:314 stop:601 length:288 start_codon:yes stop_codon:yes gene_type:complete
MYEHNMQFKEFVYIFEDFWQNSEPHTDRLERNLQDAEKVRDEQIEYFIDDLTNVQKDTIDDLVHDYCYHLKTDKEPRNGGFPNSEKMIKALVEAV